jgi:anti-sigma factor RsiW
MNCRDYETQIGDYVDDTLDETQRASVEAHLSTCASCRALVADFSVIRATSLTLEAQVPPPDMWKTISAAIEAEPKTLL